ncbi:TIR domain-containing protein [Serratia symbiotica]|uniref:CD-NTase-associated protein 12/Pycsar effector protein TIR domain-containing protein n=1 Tax=Serratia symbiotica TaxID=138074 RepID=A0A455VQ75_9GAMM|nr:TIR domain-containing protein [Serratia symbiotica]BBI92846.1 uncharacterized protein SSYIS1_27610 [Serratia symbiotica]
MLENTEMALKYPHPLDTFHKFLADCELEIEQHCAEGNKECFRLTNGAIVNLYSNGTVQIQGVKTSKSKVEVLIGERLGTAPVQATQVQIAQEQPKKIFIVHGHDHAAKEQLELILHKLGLPDHFILQNNGGTGLTIIEELEREIGQGQTATRFGIVLLTPDDMGYSKKEGETGVQPRARQNVVLEMGMLLSETVI